MQPTLNPDSSHMMQDIVLLDRYPALVAAAGAQSKAYQIGDVVAVRSPANPSSLVIKRLIGMPGSIVRTLAPHAERSVRVPPGHCWIEGDERFHSKDSNAYGPVPLGLVTARVAWILWPPSRFGRVGPPPSNLRKRVVEPRSDFM